MTFTRIYIGEPRLEGTPRGSAPCSEPRLVSANLMQALGTFENATSEFSGDGDAFFRDTSPLSVHEGSETGWTFQDASYGALTSIGLTSIARSATNPRTGTNALRVVWATDDNTGILYLAGGKQCDDMLSPPVSFRADPGDLVTFSIWYEVNFTTSGPSWGINLEAANESGGVLDIVQDDGSISDVGTFAQLSVDLVMPDDTYWVRCAIRISGGGTFDFDDGVCSLA